MLRASLGSFWVGSHLFFGDLFPVFPNVRLEAFGSQTTAWLCFHSVVSIVTKRRSDWPLLGTAIALALKSIFGILAPGAKEGCFGC